MQRYRTLAFVFLFVSSFAITGNTPSHAQTAAAPPTIVTVAFNAAVLQTAQAQRDFSDLQTKFAPRQNHLQTLNNEVESLKKQLSDSAAKLNEAERDTKLHTLDTDQRQLQREADDYKADTEAASQQAFQTNAQKLYVFLQEYAKQHGCSVVIDRGSDAAPTVWYAAAGVDITEQLVKAFDLQAGVNSSPAGTPAKHLPSAPMPSPH
jgi:outer membrane protein